MPTRTAQLRIPLSLLTVLALAPPATAGQTEKVFDEEVSRQVTFPYLVSQPAGDASPDEKFPAILFLHGMGERGDDLERVKEHGPPKLLAEGKEFPFIVISPQCPRDRWWKVDDLIVFLDRMLEEHPIDPERVYLTGLSMGGFATWMMASEYPDRFAAIAPICGGGIPGTAWRLRGMPIWAFHGAKDDRVPLRHSEEMIDAVERFGGEAKLTVYPAAEHDSWTQTYENPDLYSWFLEHKKSGRSERAGRGRSRRGN